MLGAGEVEYARQHRTVGSVAQEAQHVGGRVVGVDPGVPLGPRILAPQRRAAAVDLVDVGDETQDAAGEAVLVELEPIQAAVLGPFGALPELLAHE